MFTVISIVDDRSHVQRRHNKLTLSLKLIIIELSRRVYLQLMNNDQIPRNSPRDYILLFQKGSAFNGASDTDIPRIVKANYILFSCRI